MDALKEARKKLPKFAKALAPDAVSVAALRGAVLDEFNACRRGENPLTVEQVEALGKFLAETR